MRGRCDGVKILGEGELDQALTVKVARDQRQRAQEKIEKAGGTVELIRVR